MRGQVIIVMIIILRTVQKILGGVKKTMDVPLLLSLLSMEKEASTSLAVCIFNKKYIPLLITQTLANSYLALEPKSLSSGLLVIYYNFILDNWNPCSGQLN